MNRKLFIKNMGLGFGTFIAGPINLAFSKNINNNIKTLMLGSFESSGNQVKIIGKFLDTKTLEPISATIFVQKEFAFFTKKDKIKHANSFEISNDLGNSFSEKLNFEITAPGYKTFDGQLLLSKSSVNIDSSFWQYNPDFKAENRPNNHKMEKGILTATFDFHLVKL